MTNILTRSGIVLTTAFALAATMASAQAPTVNVDNSQEGSGGSSQPSKARATRYCIIDTVSGSRIPLKVCKTRKEWQAEGVEIPAGR